jgi:flagellar basal-body rod protein FlgF
MSRDIYPSLSGATAAWRHMEVVANNVSNANTDGFKTQRLRFENVLMDPGLLGDGYVQADHSVQDFQDGSIRQDNVPTHLALQGKAFFAVEGAGGGEVLQRAGNFQLDVDGYLVTADGEKVKGQSGPIQLLNGRGELVVARDGAVLVDGEEVDRLRIVDAAELTPIGATKWTAPGGAVQLEQGQVNVVQGALESSNLDPMRAMTDLIQTSRYFEMYQKAMQTSHEMDGRGLQVAEKQA